MIRIKVPGLLLVVAGRNFYCWMLKASAARITIPSQFQGLGDGTVAASVAAEFVC